MRDLQNRPTTSGLFRAGARALSLGFALVAVALAVGTAWHVAVAAPVIEPAAAVAAGGDLLALEQVYNTRPDLQSAFPGDHTAIPAVRKGGVADLEDWARKYGYKEYASLLSSFAPRPAPLQPVAGKPAPRLRAGAAFNFDTVTASSVYVADAASRHTLMSYRATQPHPLASISKLVTAMVVLDQKPSLKSRFAIVRKDEVGGARLNVGPRDTLSRLQMLNVTLIGSANNTANALARSIGIPREEFVGRMNAKAKALGLRATSFVDPTGIEVENTSTAEEVAAIGFAAFGYDDIRRATSTPKYSLTLSRGLHTVKNTDGLLTDETNGLVVTGGKTGYLNESLWNLVVRVQDRRKRPIVVVVFGSATQKQSFIDAERVARWVWDNYEWSS